MAKREDALIHDRPSVTSSPTREIAPCHANRVVPQAADLETGMVGSTNSRV
jgi:hypothetical protein